MRLILPLLALLAAPAFAAPAADCTALHAELETLRAKVRTLEAAQRLPVAPTAPAAASALPGTAAKPTATATVVIEEPYSRTGCRKGLFEPIAAAKWQDAQLWLDLERGQSPAEVERLLGVEHYDEQGGGNVIWHYGKCGAASLAQVLFTQGRLADWRAPSN
ncbi:MAG: hypothetical protein V4709_00775 [Pseudomonadota bacterium]